MYRYSYKYIIAFENYVIEKIIDCIYVYFFDWIPGETKHESCFVFSLGKKRERFVSVRPDTYISVFSYTE